MRYRIRTKGILAVAAVVAFFSLARPSAAQSFRSGDSGWRSRGGDSRRGDFRGGIERRGGGFRDRGDLRWRRHGFSGGYYGYVAPYPVYDSYAVPYDGYYDGYDAYAPGYAVPYVAPVYPRYAYGARVSIRIPVPRLRIPFPHFGIHFRR